MTTAPYWGTLCKESKVALYLMVMIIPLEVLVLGTAAWGAIAQKKQVVFREGKSSYVLSDFTSEAWVGFMGWRYEGSW
jgi:uncharacterized membrane protein